MEKKEAEASTAQGLIEVDNSSSVLEKIATLYAEQLMSDINLVVSGVSYPAHRLILCATSEVFQVMLMNREWLEWRESAIELKETPACAAVFPLFLRYIYTGLIRISEQTALPVLSLADKYNIQDLVSLCVSYMSDHLTHAMKQGTIVEWLQYTMSCGHNQVAKACQNFVKYNLEMIADTSDFENFEPEVLISLLHQNDLVVESELTLYHFVVRWLDRQKAKLSAEDLDLSEEELQVHLESLVLATMSHIRFPMMTPRQLAGLLLNPLTQAHKEFFVERMAIGMSYHSGHTEKINEFTKTDEGRLLFTPRLYTEDRWTSMLTIDNFQSLECYHTRTFVFSSHANVAEHTGDKTCEWVIDLFPKGVWFKKALLICWQGTYEVPEAVLRTVRLAVTCRDPPRPSDFDIEEPCMRVKIGILIRGVQWGIEYVMTVKERIFHFSYSQRVLNIDDVLDFDELNTPIYSPPPPASSSQHYQNTSSSAPSTSRTGMYKKPRIQCMRGVSRHCGGEAGGAAGGTGGEPCSCCPEPPANLVGVHRDQLKIQVIITPLTDACCVTPPEFGFK